MACIDLSPLRSQLGRDPSPAARARSSFLFFSFRSRASRGRARLARGSAARPRRSSTSTRGRSSSSSRWRTRRASHTRESAAAAPWGGSFGPRDLSRRSCLRRPHVHTPHRRRSSVSFFRKPKPPPQVHPGRPCALPVARAVRSAALLAGALLLGALLPLGCVVRGLLFPDIDSFAPARRAMPRAHSGPSVRRCINDNRARERCPKKTCA